MIIASNVNSVRVDDWTAKRVIIASNANSVCVDVCVDVLTIADLSSQQN